jgi:cold shock protein
MKKFLALSCFVCSVGFAEVGFVKSYSEAKGHGFIDIPCSNDLFVHMSAVEKSGLETLTPGECVSFDIIPKRDGFEVAENLQSIDCSEVETKCTY